MNRFELLETVSEFTYDGITYGVYYMKFNKKPKVFIRNGDSVGAVEHLYCEPASKCVFEIREDCRKEFFECLS